MVPAWNQVITDTYDAVIERLDDRARLLRGAGMINEANEALLCANTVRTMKKELQAK